MQRVVEERPTDNRADTRQIDQASLPRGHDRPVLATRARFVTIDRCAWKRDLCPVSRPQIDAVHGRETDNLQRRCSALYVQSGTTASCKIAVDEDVGEDQELAGGTVDRVHRKISIDRDPPIGINAADQHVVDCSRQRIAVPVQRIVPASPVTAAVPTHRGQQMSRLKPFKWNTCQSCT